MDIKLPTRKPGPIGDKLKRHIEVYQESRGLKKIDGKPGNETAGGMLDEIEIRTKKMEFLTKRVDVLADALQKCQGSNGQSLLWGGIVIAIIVIGLAATMAVI